MNKLKLLDIIGIVALTVSVIVMLIGLAGILGAARRDYTAYNDLIRPLISSGLFTAGFIGLYIQLLVCNLKSLKQKNENNQ